jgi:hypothetical protein
MESAFVAFTRLPCPAMTWLETAWFQLERFHADCIKQIPSSPGMTVFFSDTVSVARIALRRCGSGQSIQPSVGT